MASSPAARLGAIVKLIADGGRVVVTGSGWGERGRVQAVEIDWPSQALALEGVGLVGVEADGAAGRGFKAPADHEPVIPAAATHVIACVSVTVLGRPLDETSTHRPDRVIALTGATIGDPITPEIIAAVLAHPQGGRKGAPPSARFAVAITQASLNPSGVEAIARACRESGVNVVVGYDAKTEAVYCALSHAASFVSSLYSPSQHSAKDPPSQVPDHEARQHTLQVQRRHATRPDVTWTGLPGHNHAPLDSRPC